MFRLFFFLLCFNSIWLSFSFFFSLFPFLFDPDLWRKTHTAPKFFLWKCAEFQSIFHFSPAKEHRTNSKRSAHNLFKYIRVFLLVVCEFTLIFLSLLPFVFTCCFLLTVVSLLLFIEMQTTNSFIHFFSTISNHTQCIRYSQWKYAAKQRKKEINSFVGLNEQCTNTRTLSTWILRDHRVVYE